MFVALTRRKLVVESERRRSGKRKESGRKTVSSSSGRERKGKETGYDGPVALE